MIAMVKQWYHYPWVRRATFLGTNLAAALVAIGLVIQPIYMLLADRDAEIATQKELLAALTARASREADVQALAGRIEAEAARGEFLSGANEGVANADLQARLKSMSESAGARLRSVQGLPAKTDGPVRYIGARIDIFGSLGAVHRAVHAMESSRPYLFVTNAIIKPSSLATRQGVPAEPVIDAQLEVFGAMQMQGRE